MPALKFKGIEVEKLRFASKELIDELEQLLQCPRSYFTLEVIQSIFVRDGELVKGSPVVEVAWFDRGQETQDEAAKVITKHVNAMGYKEVDVIFMNLEKNKYYENGEHF
ncbi:DUF1904 domain-containing protein [Desnuesiella massiliensis]|uniref:DUF1904 domain-containing protein n=1 Tax=Desnuesiella massiliensis TaxID=1650662 RepID=UPI0006E29857|nr:DUF1904 domain-containing protein [Desnuesiella massiliensis]